MGRGIKGEGLAVSRQIVAVRSRRDRARLGVLRSFQCESECAVRTDCDLPVLAVVRRSGKQVNGVAVKSVALAPDSLSRTEVPFQFVGRRIRLEPNAVFDNRSEGTAIRSKTNTTGVLWPRASQGANGSPAAESLASMAAASLTSTVSTCGKRSPSGNRSTPSGPTLATSTGRDFSALAMSTCGPTDNTTPVRRVTEASYHPKGRPDSRSG
jgi:hypothetical protein